MDAKQTIIVRPMVKKDMAQVSCIMCLGYQWLAENLEYSQDQLDFLLSEQGSEKFVCQESKTQNYLVASVNDEVVGMAAVKDNKLAKLYVHPDHHNKKIGSALFQRVEELIAEAGFGEMIVCSWFSGIEFYKKMGMTQFAETQFTTSVFAGYKVPLMRKKIK